MATAKVTQIGRYVLSIADDHPPVRVTQIARRVLYAFTCEPVIVVPPTPGPPPEDCPASLLEDEVEKPMPHFLRSQGYNKTAAPSPSGNFPVSPTPGTGLKRRF